MAWIEQIEPGRAEGLLKQIYEAAIKRAGKLFNIIRIQGQSPRTLRASMGMYQETMFGDSPLSRAQREMLATVVSRSNECFY